MTREFYTSGSPFEAEFGYSRAVVQGEWCFMAGVTGYDYKNMSLPADAAAQAHNCFATIRDVLTEAGFAMQDIIRVQYTVPDRALIAEMSPVFGEMMADVRPAATLVIAGLLKPEMKIEVEVTALRR